MPTSTRDVRCNEFHRAFPYPPLAPCAIKWSSRAGVRKFDGEIEEKEADETVDGAEKEKRGESERGSEDKSERGIRYAKGCGRRIGRRSKEDTG